MRALFVGTLDAPAAPQQLLQAEDSPRELRDLLPQLLQFFGLPGLRHAVAPRAALTIRESQKPGKSTGKRRSVSAQRGGMKFHTEYLTFNTRKHREYIHITPQVEEALRKSGIQEGMVLVSAMHITAGVYVNDNESGLIHDIDKWLEGLAPFREDYLHHQTGESNGDSHLKSLLLHHEVIVPVTAGKLDLGPWQRVFYAEFDGQRKKRLIIKVMGE